MVINERTYRETGAELERAQQQLNEAFETMSKHVPNGWEIRQGTPGASAEPTPCEKCGKRVSQTRSWWIHRDDELLCFCGPCATFIAVIFKRD